MTDEALKIITEKHRDATLALAEHLSLRGDDHGFELMLEIVDYTSMLARFLNDSLRKRIENGNAQKHQLQRQ